MANRVLFGQRGGSPGFFVSKPGVDVVTAADDDLLLSTLQTNLQIVQSGVIPSAVWGSAGNTITIPDQGFHPIIFYSCMWGIGTITYISNTSVKILIPAGGLADDGWPPIGTAPSMDDALYYAVTNLPID